MKQETRPRFSVAAARAWLLVSAVAAVVAAPRCLRFCDTALYHVPEPAGWPSWPMATIDSRHARFCDEDGCGRPGLRYDGYDQLKLFHAPGTDVYVDGRMAHTGGIFHPGPKHAQFNAALRVVKDRWVGFDSPRSEVVLVTAALELVILIAGFVVARRRLQTAARLADSVRAAYVSVASDGPAYRRGLPEGTPLSVDACLAGGERDASRALGASYAAAIVVLVVFVTWAGWLVFRTTR